MVWMIPLTWLSLKPNSIRSCKDGSRDGTRPVGELALCRKAARPAAVRKTRLPS
jgi:hypothetical protein